MEPEVQVWVLGVDPETPFFKAVLGVDDDALVEHFRVPRRFAQAGVVGERHSPSEAIINRLLREGRLQVFRQSSNSVEVIAAEAA
jgi:hypothetical protein